MNRIAGWSKFVLAATVIVAASAFVYATEPINVLSFNIRYDNPNDGENRWELRKDAVALQIRDVDPDILCLQEALRHQLDDLHTLVPGYEEIGVGRDDGIEAGEYSAILLRENSFDIVAQNTFWLSDSYAIPGSRSFGNNVVRIVTCATLATADGDTFSVFNTHLDHESQPSRDASVRLIRYLMWQYGSGPLILVGDFNAGEKNSALAALHNDYLMPTAIRDGKGDMMTVEWLEPDPGDGQPWHEPFRDSFRVIHPNADSVGTFNAWSGKRGGDKIDYVFVSSGWDVLDAGILHEMVNGRYTSDHFPVYAKVSVSE